ncbi:MAG TPA: orotidine-5'-phosphate decarboxylase [Acidimicrobiales bacterium]|nr:orotidine-5'-phosphate decarboxylase [Acidimicrobiales bacterium]
MVAEPQRPGRGGPVGQRAGSDPPALPFGERVVEAVGALGPLCVGIDPSASLLSRWGLPDDVSGLGEFGSRCLHAFAGVVPVVKPQVAFFERHGAAGIGVLEKLLGEARQAGLLVIADAKRGDIDNTSAAYADAWLRDGSPLAADAVTVNPYLGLGALRPMTAMAVATGRGVVVVVRSSNPEGRLLQEAVTAAGDSVEDALLAEVAALNAAEGAAVGSVGVVVGATLEPSGFELSGLGGIILAPGVGAQGAGPSDVARLFGGCPGGTVLPNVSRSVLSHGPDVAELRAAAIRARDGIAAANA